MDIYCYYNPKNGKQKVAIYLKFGCPRKVSEKFCLGGIFRIILVKDLLGVKKYATIGRILDRDKQWRWISVPKSKFLKGPDLENTDPDGNSDFCLHRIISGIEEKVVLMNALHKNTDYYDRINKPIKWRLDALSAENYIE